MKGVRAWVVVALGVGLGMAAWGGTAAAAAPERAVDIEYVATALVGKELVRLQTEENPRQTDLPRLLHNLRLTPEQMRTLERMSQEETRPIAERCAALVLLGSVADPEREQAVLTVLEEVHRDVEQGRVVSYEQDLAALGARLEGGLPGFSASPAQSSSAIPPAPLRLTPGDFSILAKLSLLPLATPSSEDGRPLRWWGAGLAQVLLGTFEDRRALDVLLFARDIEVRGSDPRLYAFRVMAAQSLHRDRFFRWLKQNSDPKIRRTQMLLAIAYYHDPRVRLAFISYFASLNSLPRTDWVRDAHPSSEAQRALIEAYKIAAAWGDSAFAPELERSLYKGLEAASYSHGCALSALHACGGQVQKEPLWALLESDTPSVEAYAVLKLLVPFLTADDQPRFVAWLDRARWEREDFRVKVGLIKYLPPAFLTPSLEEPLVRIIDKHPKPQIRAVAIRSLGRFSSPTLVPKLREILGKNDSQPEVVVEVVRVLTEKASDPGKEFMAVLTDKRVGIRRAAAGLLAESWLSAGPHPLSEAMRNHTDVLFPFLLQRIEKEPVEDIRIHLLRGLYVYFHRMPSEPDYAGAEQRRKDALRTVSRWCKRGTPSEMALAVNACLLMIRTEQAAQLLDKMAAEHEIEAVRKDAARTAQAVRDSL